MLVISEVVIWGGWTLQEVSHFLLYSLQFQWLLVTELTVYCCPPCLTLHYTSTSFPTEQQNEGRGLFGLMWHEGRNAWGNVQRTVALNILWEPYLSESCLVVILKYRNRLIIQLNILLHSVKCVFWEINKRSQIHYYKFQFLLHPVRNKYY